MVSHALSLRQPHRGGIFLSKDDIRALAVIAARATHGLNLFAANYAGAMRQISYQDRNDTVVERMAMAEQPSTPEQRRSFILGQLADAPDSEALEAVQRYCIRNRL